VFYIIRNSLEDVVTGSHYDCANGNFRHESLLNNELATYCTLNTFEVPNNSPEIQRQVCTSSDVSQSVDCNANQ
jgi:hypothetical protein